MANHLDPKNLLLRTVVVAIIFAAAGFLYTIFLPKGSQITGKIVIVPSGTSPTAGQNLYLEAGNTVEIINSPSFKKNILGDQASNFIKAESVQNSSVVAVEFSGNQDGLKSVEDEIVSLPGKISTYTRDIYGGSPFKYLLISDPEISSVSNSASTKTFTIWGFFAGAVLYLIYWLAFSSIKVPSWEERIESAEQKANEEEGMVSPEIGKMKIEKAGAAKDLPLPALPEKEVDAEPVITPRDFKNVAPDNLPIADMGEEKPGPDFSEPSDEEVKERLNKLMRGEL